ncbi:hypothetical protein [Kitasatospora sp. NPDC056731]
MNEYLRFLIKTQDETADEAMRIAQLAGFALLAFALAANTYALFTQ